MPRDITEPAASLTGKMWKASPPGQGNLVARVLSARGIARAETARFLDPRVDRETPGPFSFKDMDKAVARILDALMLGERIGIWTDYDVDGATSGAILADWLGQAGNPPVRIHVPDRITEGYGPNAPGLRDFKASGVDLCVILDAGTVAFDALEAARDAGLDVVVVDHHLAGGTLPPAAAVVNPNRRDEDGSQGHICAAGMTLLLCLGLSMEMSRMAREGRAIAATPDVDGLLDLAALGTVCDVVPLKGFNRAVVSLGLKTLTRRRRPGIAALAKVADIAADREMTEKDCGFVLGPRLNAGGRIGDPMLAVRILTETDPDTVVRIAHELDNLNTERKRLDREVSARAMDAFGDRTPGVDRRLAMTVVDAHEGVLGISASRVKDGLDAPSLVLTPVEGGCVKGSMRSVTGFDCGAALNAAARAGLAVKAGGHGMAGGVTLRTDRLDDFEAFMNEAISASAYAAEGVSLEVDQALGLDRIDIAGIESLAALRPFGAGNPEPVFAVTGLTLDRVQYMKEVHMKLHLSSGSSGIEALRWNAAGSPLAAALESNIGRRVDIAGTIEINTWNNRRSLQIMMLDARLSRN